MDKATYELELRRHLDACRSQKPIPPRKDLDDLQEYQCRVSDLESIIVELDDDELGDSFEIARSESEQLGMFQWRGVTRKID